MDTEAIEQAYFERNIDHAGKAVSWAITASFISLLFFNNYTETLELPYLGSINLPAFHINLGILAGLIGCTFWARQNMSAAEHLLKSINNPKAASLLKRYPSIITAPFRTRIPIFMLVALAYGNTTMSLLGLPDRWSIVGLAAAALGAHFLNPVIGYRRPWLS